MSEQQIAEIQDLVEGLVAGRMLEIGCNVRYKDGFKRCGIPRETIKRVSHNAGAYVAGELKGLAA